MLEKTHLSLDDLFAEKKVTKAKDPEKSELENMDDNALTRYVQKTAHLIEKIAEVGMPQKNQQIRLITRRTFNAIQFLQHIVETEIIIDLKIAIYSINYHAAKILIQLIDDGKIKNAQILMSNLRNGAHREKEQIIKNQLIDRKEVDLFFCSSHAKVFSCKTDQGNYYTVEGSGNLAYNSRIEQYIIDNDEALYTFTCSWFQQIKEFLKGKKEFIQT